MLSARDVFSCWEAKSPRRYCPLFSYYRELRYLACISRVTRISELWIPSHLPYLLSHHSSSSRCNKYLCRDHYLGDSWNVSFHPKRTQSKSYLFCSLEPFQAVSKEITFQGQRGHFKFFIQYFVSISFGKKRESWLQIRNLVIYYGLSHLTFSF